MILQLDIFPQDPLTIHKFPSSPSDKCCILPADPMGRLPGWAREDRQTIDSTVLSTSPAERAFLRHFTSPKSLSLSSIGTTGGINPLSLFRGLLLFVPHLKIHSWLWGNGTRNGQMDGTSWTMRVRTWMEMVEIMTTRLQWFQMRDTIYFGQYGSSHWIKNCITNMAQLSKSKWAVSTWVLRSFTCRKTFGL